MLPPPFLVVELVPYNLRNSQQVYGPVSGPAAAGPAIGAQGFHSHGSARWAYRSKVGKYLQSIHMGLALRAMRRMIMGGADYGSC